MFVFRRLLRSVTQQLQHSSSKCSTAHGHSMSLNQRRSYPAGLNIHCTTLPKVTKLWPAQLPRLHKRRAGLVCQSQLNFALYTKPECPLCDGLKDKVQGLIDRAQFMPSFLTGATLEVRDISTNEAWQDAMHLSVPVLVLLGDDDNEVVLPRPQPRITAERLQSHLEAAVRSSRSQQQHGQD